MSTMIVDLKAKVRGPLDDKGDGKKATVSVEVEVADWGTLDEKIAEATNKVARVIEKMLKVVE